MTPDSLAKAGDSMQASEGAFMPVEQARQLLGLAGDGHADFHADFHVVRRTVQAFALEHSPAI